MSSTNFLRRKFPLTYLFILSYFMLAGCSTQPPQTTHFNQASLVLDKTYAITLNPTETQKNNLMADLIAQPLTPQTSLQLFFMQSPRVQQALQELKASDAEVIQAGLIANPHISFNLLKANDSHHWIWDFNLLQPLYELAARKNRQSLAELNAQTTELEVLAQFYEWIEQLQNQYFQLLHAQLQLNNAKAQLDTSDAKVSLAAAIYKAGNLSELDYLSYVSDHQKQQLAYSNQSLDTQQNKTTLAYWLATDKDFILPNDFPEIPENNWNKDHLKNIARQHNPMLRMEQLKITSLEQQMVLVSQEYGLSQTELGVAAKQEADGQKSLGIAANIPLTLFDQGKAKLLALREKKKAINSSLQDLQLKINAAIDNSMLQMNIEINNLKALKEARLTIERRLVLAQQHMNFMLLSPFELIDLKFQLIEVDQAYAKAQLSYWEAYGQLQWNLGQSLDNAEVKMTDVKIIGLKNAEVKS